MKHRYWAGGVLSCVLLIVASFAITGTNSTATYPASPDYPVYFWDSTEHGSLFIYHPAIRELESLDLPWKPTHGITASADGRRLYLATDRSIIVLNASTFSVLADLPYRPTGPVAVSPDNRLIAVMTDSLLVLHNDTYDVLFHHPSPMRRGEFSDDSRTLCGIDGDADNAVLTVNLGLGTPGVERIPIEGGQPQKVIPAMNGRRLLVYLEEQPMLSRLAVIDRLAGAEIYSEHIFPGEGDIASAPNWERAVYTNSGDPDRIEGSSSFKIFDICANEPVEEVRTRRTDVPPALGPCPVGPVQITPDHRWLVALCTTQPPQLFLYDLENERFADWRAFDDAVHLVHLSVQAGP